MGTDYWTCLDCQRLDFSSKFLVEKKEHVPYKYHQTVDVYHLLGKEYRFDF